MFLWLLVPVLSTAQYSNLRSRLIPVQAAAQLVDTQSVAPATVRLLHPMTQMPVDPSHYRVRGNLITMDTARILPATAQVLLQYRVLPFDLREAVFRVDTSVLRLRAGDRLVGIPFDPFARDPQDKPLLPQQGLDYNGNYTRGLSFGNNQNLVLNSQFNLQMAGKLGDLDIQAAMTDNNIPLQPEGNTQQLREFDKVFVQVAKGGTKLVAGDYELTRPEGYFMNYFKKLQGATVTRRWPVADRSRGPAGGPVLETKASAAIARGRFARNTLVAQEGNQGPYRLEGAEGERFIIILAGTEKVFLDGRQMVRGQDADYTIDYNAGQLTFTNRRLITKDSRVVVEFDYSVQQYIRSLYALQTLYRGESFQWYFNTYSEQDGRQPVDDEFSAAERETLAAAGDSSLLSLTSSIDTVTTYSAFRVLYAQQDTLVDGIPYEGILLYSLNPEEARYSAVFSYVGPGNGDYLPDPSVQANGRVYRWVAPDAQTGLRQGTHAPVRRLVPPGQQQLYTAGGAWSPGSRSAVRAELAMSRTDPNRLSGRDDGDNIGVAATAGFRHAWLPVTTDTSGRSGWQLETKLDYEFVQRQFRELNPYRAAEFTRDWNLNRGANDVAIGRRETWEQLLQGELSLQTPGWGTLSYRAGSFLRDDLYTGWRHRSQYVYRKNGYAIQWQDDRLTTAGALEQSTFSRPRLALTIPLTRDSLQVPVWQAGFSAEREKNRRRPPALSSADTLLPSSFHYDLVRLAFSRSGRNGPSLQAGYQRRQDYLPQGGAFRLSTIADELNVNGAWQEYRHSRLSWNMTWRQLAIRDSSLTNLTPATTYLGRLDYMLTLFKGLVQGATSYEIGSGQERKVEFIYLQVPAGEGTHQWVDRNGDGKVQFDEVDTAPFPDLANAVRVTVFTDEFIRTNNVTFNQSLRLEPRVRWHNATGIRKLLGRFSTQSSLLVNRKVLQQPSVSAWNPFQLDIADTALVAIRSNIHNNVFFNRSHPTFDSQYSRADNRSKMLQTNGFESRSAQEQSIRLRWNLLSVFSLQVVGTLASDEQDSEQFANRRYRIQSRTATPQLTLQPSSAIRTSLAWRWKQAVNREGTMGEQLRLQDLKWELILNRSTITSLRTDLSFVKVRYDGPVNTPVGFAMLQGLQHGGNYIWNISLDRQLTRNIRASVTYEGRKTGTARVIHVGRAQVGAVF
ncbi:MAG: hypothetical protein RLY31_2260 [Bacteroidota bacterium]|jgi:hypothetical protein